MNQKRKTSVALFVLFMFICSPSVILFGIISAQAQTTSDSTNSQSVNPVYAGNRMLQEYIDLVQQKNIESARIHWSPYAKARAERLGIKYDGISIKADLNSPLVKLARYRPIITLKAGGQLDSSFLRLQIQAKHNGETSAYQYYAVWLDGYQWLTFPQDYVSQNWPTQVSRYFRFHVSASRGAYVNQIAIESLDSFVDSLGKRLNIATQRMQTLADKKIDYYFCADEQEVERITGVAVRGLYDLAADALITSTLPHYHEVAHLMVNFHLQSMPLTTLPLLREGMATYLGGRSTSAPSPLLDMAAYLYRLQVVDVDSLLELMAFHKDLDASISYAAAALFIKSLVETYGMEAVLELYRELSGNLDQTRKLSSATIRERISKRLKTNWQNISEHFRQKYITGEFHDHVPDVYLRPGLSGLAAGDSTRLSRMKSAQMRLARMGLASEPLDENVETSRFKTMRNVTLIQADGRIYVRAHPDRAGELKTTILFGKLQLMDLATSELFEEQFSGSLEFKGYRYGLRFDEHEAGIYDYATSTLSAKYLTSFSPRERYYNPQDSTVSFSFPLTLTTGVSPLNDPVILSR